MSLVPDQCVYLVFPRKSLSKVALVLPHAFDQIRRHADIERAVLLTCQYVDAWLFQSDVDGTGAQPSLGRRVPSPVITASLFEAILNSLLNWKWNQAISCLSSNTRCRISRRMRSSVSSSIFCLIIWLMGRISVMRKLTQLGSSKRTSPLKWALPIRC